MDDRKLEIFLTALRSGSFNKAAKKLNCTQSSVTQMMNALEEELNCKLLKRNFQGIQLTEKGSQLYPFIENVWNSMNELKEQANTLSKTPDANLRIGSFSSISNTWLPPLLHEYKHLHPEVTFSLRIGTQKISSWLNKNEIDLALGDADRCPGSTFVPLMEDPYYAVLPDCYADAHNDSITQEQLVKYPFITAPFNSLDRHLTSVPENALEVDSDDDSTLLNLVFRGLGVTAVPEMSLINISQDVCILDLLPKTSRMIGAALPLSPTKTAQSFIAFLKTKFPESDQLSLK